MCNLYIEGAQTRFLWMTWKDGGKVLELYLLKPYCESFQIICVGGERVAKVLVKLLKNLYYTLFMYMTKLWNSLPQHLVKSINITKNREKYTKFAGDKSDIGYKRLKSTGLIHPSNPGGWISAQGQGWTYLPCWTFSVGVWLLLLKEPHTARDSMVCLNFSCCAICKSV